MKGGHDPALSFVAYLEQRLAQSPPRQKGLRTRERLKIAAAKVLAAKGYHGLRVVDVTETAGLAEGSFYIYFKDKSDVSLAVLKALLEEFVQSRFDAATKRETAFAAIRDTNRTWIALCRANAGLMRCVLQLGDESPAFAELLHRTNHSWYIRVAASVVRQHSAGAVNPKAALLAVHMLGSMMDELARRLLIQPQGDLLTLLSEIGADDDGLADAASVLWMRCLYPGTPILGPLSPAAAALADWPA